MFIRALRVRDRKGKYKYTYYCLVRSERKGDRVISQHVAYLGRHKAISARQAKEIAKELGIKPSELKKVKGLRVH